MAQDNKSYDENIARLVHKIQQYPGREKYLEELKQDFNLANSIDQERISALIKTGQPDIWFEIHSIYKRLDNRQKDVMKLPEKSIQQAGITFKDYSQNISETEHRAILYLHAHGEKLLQSENPADARQAYSEFLTAASLDPAYKNLDRDIRVAVLKGATNVKFELRNRTNMEISTAMIDQLTVIIWEFKKAKYGQAMPDQPDNSFVFTLRVNLENIEIGPDQIKDVQYKEERDLFNGDQVVDTISCMVTESKQLKKARLTGSLEYIDNQSGVIVNRVPIIVESVFTNSYAFMSGNPLAAGEETLKLLGSKKAEYPSADKMLQDATEEFTKRAREVILGE
jgi:hypothetical protein